MGLLYMEGFNMYRRNYVVRVLSGGWITIPVGLMGLNTANGWDRGRFWDATALSTSGNWSQRIGYLNKYYCIRHPQSPLPDYCHSFFISLILYMFLLYLSNTNVRASPSRTVFVGPVHHFLSFIGFVTFLPHFKSSSLFFISSLSPWLSSLPTPEGKICLFSSQNA